MSSNKTRFSVGEKLYAIHFAYEGKKDFGFGMPYLYDDAPISKINIIELTVTEHHKVRGDFDSDQKKPKYDGFILTDKEGNIWHNQYPRASYGQVSDESDRRFVRHLEDKSQYDTWLKEEIVFECHLLGDVVGKIDRGIKHFSKIEPRDTPDIIAKNVKNAEVLQKCIGEIRTKLKCEFQKELKEVPIWEKHPDITHFVLYDIPKEA